MAVGDNTGCLVDIRKLEPASVGDLLLGEEVAPRTCSRSRSHVTLASNECNGLARTRRLLHEELAACAWLLLCCVCH